MSFDEAKIITKAQNGDALAFAKIHDQYYQLVYRFFYYRVSDVKRAEDLTSDLFVKLIEKMGLYQPGKAPFLAWLYTIARNMLIDDYRRRARVPELSSLGDYLASDKHNPVRSAELQSDADCLKQALQHLTDDQREVIITKFIEGRRNREVADVVGKSYYAVKSLQHRALAALKRAIQEEGCYEP